MNNPPYFKQAGSYVPSDPDLAWFEANARYGEGRRAFARTQYGTKIDWAPHGDPLILHAPQAYCEDCNLYPEAQLLRFLWKINFTNEYDPKKVSVPNQYQWTAPNWNSSSSSLTFFGGPNPPTTGTVSYTYVFDPAAEPEIVPLTPEQIWETILSLRAMQKELE